MTYGDLAPERRPDELPPGWLRVPASFQVMLPSEAMKHARHRGSAAGSPVQRLQLSACRPIQPDTVERLIFNPCRAPTQLG